ncbi:hypothetical protein C8A05DRAFT_31782 [Staphylotrichum tortipilum]|uniref:Secreted protein n=1 Tax=Staphylotrichum tortipilum TaxID=2831512 RepID=A0AAN6MQ34_9PEZI|nr:hypothetical protein C8A05DRAFT_31782 [Staphylotrichum longicolle]
MPMLVLILMPTLQMMMLTADADEAQAQSARMGMRLHRAPKMQPPVVVTKNRNGNAHPTREPLQPQSRKSLGRC